MSTPGQHVAASKVRAEGLTEIPIGADLADILSRLRPEIESVLALLFEAEDLWIKAWKTENPQEKASTRRQAENKRKQWQNAMREVMANIDKLDICLLRFGPKAEGLRTEIDRLIFRSLEQGRRYFIPDPAKVVEGLRRLLQILPMLDNLRRKRRDRNRQKMVQTIRELAAKFEADPDCNLRICEGLRRKKIAISNGQLQTWKTSPGVEIEPTNWPQAYNDERLRPYIQKLFSRHKNK